MAFSPLILKLKNQPFLSYLQQIDILLIVHIKQLFGIRLGQFHFFAWHLLDSTQNLYNLLAEILFKGFVVFSYSKNKEAIEFQLTCSLESQIRP